VICPLKKWLSTLVLLSPLAFRACLPVYRYSDEAVSGRKTAPEDIAFIKPGITTRDDVISKLGKPTVELQDLRILVYPWTEFKEQWVGVVPGFVWTAPRTADWALLVATDENNRVVSSGFDQLKWSETVISQARRWAEAQQVRLPPVSTSFSSAPIPEGSAVIYIYRIKLPLFGRPLAQAFESDWALPVAVAIDSQYVTEMRDDTYVAFPVSPGAHEITADPLPSYMQRQAVIWRSIPQGGYPAPQPFKVRKGTSTLCKCSRSLTASGL
jgi:hypothetical protein